MGQISQDVLNQGIAGARGIANALKVFRTIEETLSLYAQVQTGIADLLARRDVLSGEVASIAASRDQVAEALTAETQRLATFKKDEFAAIKAEVDAERKDEKRKISNARTAVAEAQGAVELAREAHAESMKLLGDEEAALREKVEGHKAELAAIVARIGG